MKVKNGQVILNKAEIERLRVLWNTDINHNLCKAVKCDRFVEDFRCYECPLNAIAEAMELVRKLAYNEIRRQERIADKTQAEEDGQIKMKV